MLQSRISNPEHTNGSQRSGVTGVDGRVQVLNEYYVTMTLKLRPGLSEEEAWKDIDDLLTWQPAILDVRLMRRAHTANQRFSLSWWDALIVAAAQTCGCAYLLTEDLLDGQDIDGTHVVDPFRHRPDEVMTTPPLNEASFSSSWPRDSVWIE